MPDGPKKLKLKVVTDGTPENTRVLDADTGEELHFAAVMGADVASPDGKAGTARITLTFHGVPVECLPETPGPFQLAGHSFGGEAPPPEAAAPPPAAHAAAHVGGGNAQLNAGFAPGRG